MTFSSKAAMDRLYQMTIYELDADRTPPKRDYHVPSGTMRYSCGLCGAPVGIFGPKTFHEQGWLYKREACQNGHVVAWEALDE